MNRMRTLRASLKGLRKSPLVEGVDGIAHGLRVAAKTLGDLVGVLAPGAGQQDLTATEDESIGRAQPRLQGFSLGVAQRTHKDRSFRDPEDKPSTTVSSQHALGAGALACRTLYLDALGHPLRHPQLQYGVLDGPVSGRRRPWCSSTTDFSIGE